MVINKHNWMTKVALSVAFVIFFISGGYVGATPKKSTPKTKTTQMGPNFSYPKEVKKNAEKEYEKALKSNNSLQALEAAVKISIADGIISVDSVNETINRFANLSKRLESPYNRIALMLEAQTYLSVYENDRYRYDNRTLPKGEYPENIMEWSGDLFTSKVDSLLTLANVDIENVGGYDIKKLGGLIDKDETLKLAEKAGMSVADFIQSRSAEMLSQFNMNSATPLRFGDKIGTITPQAKCYEKLLMLLDESIKRNEEKGNLQLASWFSKLKYDKMPVSPASAAWLNDCFEKYGNTSFGVWTVLEKVSRIENNAVRNKRNDAGREESLKILKNYLAAHPEAIDINDIKRQIANLEHGQVEISNPDIVMPGKSWNIKLTATRYYEFSILIYRLNTNNSNDISIKVTDIPAKCKLAGNVKVKLEGTTPEIINKDVVMPELTPGQYVILPSVDGTLTGLIGDSDNKNVEIFRVTALTYFITTYPGQDMNRLFVTDARNNRPVEGAVVVVKSNDDKRTKSLKTDKDGSVKIPEGSGILEISYGKDLLRERYYSYGSRIEKGKEHESGYILTDLSIYKPGQDLKFSCVVWKDRDRNLSELPGKSVTVIFRNANYEIVDSLKLTTDNFGRVSGRFTVPENGLLGNYQIELRTDYQLYSRYVRVAEYKLPTFLVEMKGAEGEYKAGDTVILKGRALTFTGMPVASAEVKFSINYRPWRFWWYSVRGNSNCGGVTHTDADGNFTIELPTENLMGTVYENGIFTLQAEVTDMAGETQSSPAVMFALGQGYAIDADLPEMINADDENLSIKVRVVNMTGAPVNRPIYYFISSKTKESGQSKINIEGLYDKQQFLKALSEMPSGEYEMRFSLNSAPDAKDITDVIETVIIWRESDSRPPVATPLWVPENIINLKKNDTKAVVRVGSSYNDSYIFMMITNLHQLKEWKWVKINDENREIEFEVPASNERLFVTFTGMRDLESKTESVTIIPYEQNIKVDIEAESFRDKIAPGANEKWQFRFSVDGENMSNRPVMAVMSNKALNAIAPFNWYFNPNGGLSWYTSAHISPLNITDNSGYFYDKIATYSTPRLLTVPEWQFFGYPLAGQVVYVSDMVMYSMAAPEMEESSVSNSMKRSRVASSQIMIRGLSNDSAMDDSEIMEEAEVGSTSGIDIEEDGTSDIKFRPVEMPLAFFMPALVSDSKGMATISYEVPQAIGTWQFQIMGYDKDMRGGVLQLDAVAAKKVMVQMNAPRFLRTGDDAQISATIYNNSGEKMAISGRIQIVNPNTGKVLEELKSKPAMLEAGTSAPLTIGYSVPSDISSVLIRVYAVGGSHTDGEQTEVAILPSSTPVLESRPFYAAPGEQKIKVEMPKDANEANVTLQYCDNPIWECVTALPEILTPSSSNILAQVNALYGIAIANGLINHYPQLADAILTFSNQENSGDSTLVSNLAKNDDIKLTSLPNTPWVNDAADETRRMQALVKYLDKDGAQKSIGEIMKVFIDRQKSDGGWSWCEGMESSIYITGRVLLHFAMLKGLGYLPEGAEQLAIKGFRFCDNELVKEWKRNKTKTLNLSVMLNYLYLKSFFPNIKESEGFSELRKIAMEGIAKEWNRFGIYDKATAVTLEWRAGSVKLAGEILESLRQYASVSKEKGMWYDNLAGQWSAWNPLITTAQVLEAFAEVSPQDAAVNQLRQWLLMSKQTQNWSEMNGTSEVIHALLTTGSDWTVPSREAEVLIGGKRIDVPLRAKLTGSFTITLNDIKKQGVEINKYSAGPAWGGVVSQYVAPIMSVKADAVPQISIRKDIYAIGADGSVSANVKNLKVGDKVRITLTITCDRDLDYITVIDSRSACLEPAEQLSGYTMSDGLWYYQETRNTGTNLFIPFMCKGSHVVNYECYVDRAGEYTAGIASVQSQYAPVIAAHSAGLILNVRE